MKEQAGAGPNHVVFIEAESFEALGGWVVDQQYMDRMGSPFLLAHGLGEPVADATTRVCFPASGRYHVWVRTRDWVAPWGAPGSPGRFELWVDGSPLETVFGTAGVDWHWQDGGVVDLSNPSVTLALHDLTGFEGRCDAIAFCSDLGFKPPNDGAGLAAFRRKMLGLADMPTEGGQYDLVVAGAGIAGLCAALSAARRGLRVVLIHDRPVLGGNNSSEVRVWIGGDTSAAPYPRIGDVMRELDPAVKGGRPHTAESYGDAKKLELVSAEPNIALMLSHRVVKTQSDGGRLAAVVAQDILSGRRTRVAADLFADCTGDATLGFFAGADWQMTVPGRLGRSNLWRVTETAAHVAFPRCPWAIDLSEKPFPGREEDPEHPGRGGLNALGRWFWESGFEHDPFEKGEYIRDANFRAMYGAWDCLKNVLGKYPKHKLEWAAYVSGMRESRRLLGDVLLTREDVVEGKACPDACVPTAWSLDLHYPNELFMKGFEGDAFISRAEFEKYPRPYWVPYRCLYSRNIPNLFMAGRNISVTHEALGTVRVQGTTGMMGEIVGMAAAVCAAHNTEPRGVYERHLDALKELMRQGAGKNQPVAAAEVGSRKSEIGS